MNIKIKNIVLGIIILLSSQVAYAATPVNLVVNGGWYSFNIPGGAGTAWDKEFNFILVNSGTLTVTDLFLSGDRFEVFNFATSLGLTSVPTSTGDQIFVNFDAAAADPRWSTGIFQLNPGNYSVNGTLFSTPFQNSAGGIRVDEHPVTVPEPTTVFLLLVGLAISFGLKKRLKLI